MSVTLPNLPNSHLLASCYVEACGPSRHSNQCCCFAGFQGVEYVLWAAVAGLFDCFSKRSTRFLTLLGVIQATFDHSRRILPEKSGNRNTDVNPAEMPF